MKCLFLLSCSIILMYCCGNSLAAYIDTGECDERSVCSYQYFANQKYTDNSGQDKSTQINATVQITCVSAGLYDNQNATLYCMDVEDAVIFSSLINDSKPEYNSFHQKALRYKLSNWFCFVQTSNGKIPTVYHSATDAEEAVNLKKSITAGFQANFQGTSEEEEEDSSSQHTSHYTYEESDEYGKLKMSRFIHEKDIKEYTTGSKHENVESTIQEELEYRDGKLKHSTGNMVVEVLNGSRDHVSRESDDEPSLSKAFSAKGSFDLTLRSCFELSAKSSTSQKKATLLRMKYSKVEGLKAKIDTRRQAMDTMKELRSQLTSSGSVFRSLLKYKSYNGKLEGILIELMKLEASHGVLPTHRKALDDVISLMTTNIYALDRELRELVYELLTAEASLIAQQALLNAFSDAAEDAEANNILVHISLLDNVHLNLVRGLEERLNNGRYHQNMRNQLLLLYGSFAMKGGKEVEYRVMDNLIDKVVQYRNSTCEFPMSVILIALSNSGSNFSISPILSFLNNSNDNDEENKIPIAIKSLAKVIENEAVLAELDKLLQGNFSVSTIVAIIESLHSGFEHAKSRKIKDDLNRYLSSVTGHPVLETLARTVSMCGNSDVYSMTLLYFIEIQASSEIVDILHSNEHESHRQKRSTTDWDSAFLDYDYVASRASRTSDEASYSSHLAYLNSTTIGIEDANLKVVSGFFGGLSHCGNIKVFGRVIAVAKLLKIKRIMADALFNLRLTTNSGSLTAYVKIVDHYLLNIGHTVKPSVSCWKYNKNLLHLKQLLYTFTFPYFVYAGTLSLTVNFYFQLNLDFNSNLCIDNSGVTVTGALGAISPSAGLTIEGGVIGNLLGLARGGITASVSLNYQLEPAVSTQACSLDCSRSRRTCIGLYDSYPDSYIGIETWYQTGTVGVCGTWIYYPCIKWGERIPWDKFTHKWYYGRTTRRPVWQQCKGHLYSGCAASALSSALFSY